MRYVGHEIYVGFCQWPKGIYQLYVFIRKCVWDEKFVRFVPKLMKPKKFRSNRRRLVEDEKN